MKKTAPMIQPETRQVRTRFIATLKIPLSFLSAILFSPLFYCAKDGRFDQTVFMSKME